MVLDPCCGLWADPTSHLEYKLVVSKEFAFVQRRKKNKNGLVVSNIVSESFYLSHFLVSFIAIYHLENL